MTRGKSKPAVGVNRNQDTSPNSSQADQDRGGNVSFSPLTSSNFNERIYENVKFHQKRNRKKSKPHSRHDNPESIKPPEIPLCTPEICVENIDELQVEELPNQPIEIVTIEELQDEAAVCTVTAYVTPSPQYCTRECLSLSREKLLNMKEGDRHLKSKIPVKRTQKKLKRIAVEDYFFPMLRSPVYLDVINEETSSLSNEEDDTLTLTQPGTSYQSTTLPVPWKTRQEQEFEEQQEREREEDEEFEEIVQEEIGIEDKSEDEEREDSNRINNDLAYPTTLAILTENKIELVPITKDVPEEIDTNEHTEPVTPPTDTLNPKDRQSRSPSFGSCCSSRSSSIVTAINVGNNYNPHSSVGNMEQFLAGLERPGTLRELCLNRLLSLPFGKEVLQELAEVSQNLQGLTEKLSEYAQQYQYQSPNLTEQPNVVNNNNNNNNNNYLEDSNENQSPECSEDRTCSSKSEQEYDEWIKSFIRHHKNIIDSKVSSAVEEVKFSNASVSSDYKDSDKNRLLDIILAESDCQAMNDSKETKDVSTGDLLTNITSEITKNTTTVISTSSEDSLVNLNNSPKKELKENDSVTRNNLYNPKFSAQSGSNIELEMTYLLIKEKQIQKELEKLEEEKRKIYAELSSEECSSCSMNINKTPEMDKLSKEPQHQAMTEFFRQKMFDEYMKKIAERESRLQHKIIKVSSGSNFLDAALNEEGKTDVVHVKKLEEEFLERVKEKRKHGKLVDDDEEDSRDSSGLVSDADVSENDEESPMLVLDGISVEHESSLPSHLKEFLALAKNAPVTENQLSKNARENAAKPPPAQLNQANTAPAPAPPPPPPLFNGITTKEPPPSPSKQEPALRISPFFPREFNGIGPTTKDGMPLILRSEIKNEDQSRWYKKMYDTIHKPRKINDEYVTIRYKQRRPQYPYISGYLSEPGSLSYDSDMDERVQWPPGPKQSPQVARYTTTGKTAPATLPRTLPPSKPWSSYSDIVEPTHKNQPKSIANYHPGKSSITGKETEKWWDEVMDIFNGLEKDRPNNHARSKPNLSLKESGYDSDSTLVFHRKEEPPRLAPAEQKEAYITIQKGGDVPFSGLRKPAPEKPTSQPRQYVERDVTIHYRTPVRQEVKEMVGEEELAHRQAEAMRRLYQEESQRKRLQVSNSLQELKDMHSRRHTDNFMPSQKSPIPLDRYEHLPDFPVARIPRGPPEPHLVARALYNFVGQTSRELTFRKGDLIRLRRQVDNNWYEGECNAMTGLFPVNYVEILPYTEVKSAPSKKTFEGQARAKYNFTAQTQLELSLSKGELVTITRRVDNNWFEGKIGGRKGIFPVSYVEVLTDPGSPTIPNLCLPPVSIPAKVPVSKNARPERVADGSLDNGIKFSERRPLNQTLHIETQSETTPYRALFKYLPQNEDELELIEGDVVYVLEKCDDGWYVGSSERTGAFGTFPGNYVHKI